MRTPRQISKTNIYHVFNRGSGKQIIFEDDNDRCYFLKLLKNISHERRVDIYCWCLMPNHFHILLSGDLDNISKLMKNLCSLYAKNLNKKRDTCGHVFQDRFKSEPVENESYLLNVARYIHQNPIKAGLSKNCNYKWSSYQEYLNNSSWNLCKTSDLISVFGNAEYFYEFHSIFISDFQCLDIDSDKIYKYHLNDNEAKAIAQNILGDISTSELIALPKNRRNKLLASLKNAGLSTRKIQRLTGIGLNIIQRAK